MSKNLKSLWETENKIDYFFLSVNFLLLFCFTFFYIYNFNLNHFKNITLFQVTAYLLSIGTIFYILLDLFKVKKINYTFFYILPFLIIFYLLEYSQVVILITLFFILIYYLKYFLNDLLEQHIFKFFSKHMKIDALLINQETKKENKQKNSIVSVIKDDINNKLFYSEIKNKKSDKNIVIFCFIKNKPYHTLKDKRINIDFINILTEYTFLISYYYVENNYPTDIKTKFSLKSYIIITVLFLLSIMILKELKEHILSISPDIAVYTVLFFIFIFLISSAAYATKNLKEFLNTKYYIQNINTLFSKHNITFVDIKDKKETKEIGQKIVSYMNNFYNIVLYDRVNNIKHTFNTDSKFFNFLTKEVNEKTFNILVNIVVTVLIIIYLTIYVEVLIK